MPVFYLLKTKIIETPNNTALIIFIKNAEKGKVKTRLAKTVGDNQALKIYKALLQLTRNATQSVNTQRFLFYSNFINGEDEWSEAHFHKLLQHGRDLGEKMKNAFQDICQTHRKVVIIGSDCASLTDKIINEAFQQLDAFPFVIGPATDGGYYLLGMNQYLPAVFENIAWSTSDVFPKTLQIIKNLGKTYYLLPELSDIDTEEDWQKYGWEIKS